MKKNKLKLLYFLFIFIFLYSCILVTPAQASIFDNIYDNLGEFTGRAGLPGGQEVDVPDIIVSIINVILGLLAVVFIIMILIGGFRYMTAGGNAENAKKALDIIKNAIIGVIIVLLSGVFVNYILEEILKIGQ